MKKILVVFALFCAVFQLFADDDDKLKLAVMDFEDLSGEISEETLIGASEYIRIAFASTNRYIIISKDRQKGTIRDMRKKFNTDPSYKSCTDKNCQIQLGQALSADMIVKTTVSFFAGSYTLASEVIDLEKEATIIAASEDYDGSPASLKAAMNSIVAQIVKAEKKNREPAQRVVEQPVYRNQPAEPHYSKDARDCEYARAKSTVSAWKNYLRKHDNGECAEEAELFIKEFRQDEKACQKARNIGTVSGWNNYLESYPDGQCAYEARQAKKLIKETTKQQKEKLLQEANKGRKTRNAGITLLVLGSTTLILGFSLGAATDSENNNSFLLGAITGGIIGGSMVLSGIICTGVGVQKKNRAESQLELINVSVLPTKGGAYASLGFSF